MQRKIDVAAEASYAVAVLPLQRGFAEAASPDKATTKCKRGCLSGVSGY